jgi:hypothetical protein
MHKCDTPACVNVAHLDAVPPIENELDKVRKGRQARGERLSLAQGNATLTKEQAMEIFQSNDLQKTLVAKYGISQGAISAIKTKRTWRHMHGL